MLEKLKICPYSDEEFIPKRNNQIYACKDYRIAVNNEKQRDKRNSTLETDKILHCNYYILKSLLGEHKSKEYSSEFLKGKGFNFSKLTEVKVNNNITYYCLYDYAYYKTQNNRIIILKIWKQ